MNELAKQYRKVDEIEHVLIRPGMYIGSTKSRTDKIWILDGKFQLEDITYNPGFLKLFDEIVLNAVDESKRNKTLNQISIKVNCENGEISIYDNGGIPVIVHPDEKQYIPEMIFSNLRAGSNFNDDEQRTGAGTNGVGASLTNIYSKRFLVETCDKQLLFTQEFRNNMSECDVPKIKKFKDHYTRITYIPDFSRFEMTSIDADHYKMLRKRAMDIAACNPNLKVTFNGELFTFKTFQDYVKLYVNDVYYESNGDWDIAVGMSDCGYQQISFVNSVDTKDGGTHTNYVYQQIINKLRPIIKRKHKIDIKPNELKNHMFIFINSKIVNPAFESQTKEKLITEPREYGFGIDVSDKLVNNIFKSEIIQSMLDWLDQKQQADERKELRQLNKGLATKKSIKLVDAKQRNNRLDCILGIFEGESAMSSIRVHRDAQIFGAYPLRGKFINVSELSPVEVIKNVEVQDLISAIGLKLGEAPNKDELRYGKIYIYTDADKDGSNITGLLLNFFGKYWPELFDMGMIYNVLTPILVAKKGKQTKEFYTDQEFEIFQKQTDFKAWECSYKKGLAALEDVEYKSIISNPKLMQFVKDHDYKEALITWFAKDSQPRKDKILGNKPKPPTPVPPQVSEVINIEVAQPTEPLLTFFEF